MFVYLVHTLVHQFFFIVGFNVSRSLHKLQVHHRAVWTTNSRVVLVECRAVGSSQGSHLGILSTRWNVCVVFESKEKLFSFIFFVSYLNCAISLVIYSNKYIICPGSVMKLINRLSICYLVGRELKKNKNKMTKISGIISSTSLLDIPVVLGSLLYIYSVRYYILFCFYVLICFSKVLQSIF